MSKTTDKIQNIGDMMVDMFHYLALFIIEYQCIHCHSKPGGNDSNLYRT